MEPLDELSAKPLDGRAAPPGALVQVLRECNYSCRHCSQDAPVKTPRPNRESLISNIEALVQVGHRKIRFTGGEPFLHPDIQGAVAYAASKGLEISFVTNASRIRAEERRWLKEYGPLELWVSFYGYPPLLHDWVCGREGAFERTITTLKTLASDGHKVGVHYPLSQASLPGCPDFVDRIGNLGLIGVKVMQLFDQGRARNMYSADVVNAAELAAWLPRLREISAIYPKLDLRISLKSGQRVAFETAGFRVPPNTGCHAGLDGYWTLDVEGYIYPCCLFLNTGTMRTVHVDDPNLDRASKEHDHKAFLTRIGHELQVAHCPALESHRCEENGEFICPLTYARLVHREEA